METVVQMMIEYGPVVVVVMKTIQAGLGLAREMRERGKPRNDRSGDGPTGA